MRETIDINIALIERCRQGDIKAQYQLYQRYVGAMYNIAMRLMNNKMDAEDVLQEAFVTAFGKLDELERPEAFGSWMRRIVSNRCISLLRKRRMVFEDIGEIAREGEFDEENGESPPYAGIEPETVNKAIRTLPDGARSILVMRAMEGYKHREIAEMLGISESTSKTQYHRALGLLREKLKEKIDAE